jgi:hypothetical protein
MAQRIYNITRNGTKVVADFRRLLQTGDVSKITPGLYHALTMHGGFIAHYGIGGFREHFRGDLTELLAGEMYPLTDSWRWGDEDDGSQPGVCDHLRNSVYRDGLTAKDVMRGICKVARELEQTVVARENELRRRAHIALAQQIANEYGVTVTPAA